MEEEEGGSGTEEKVEVGWIRREKKGSWRWGRGIFVKSGKKYTEFSLK